MVHDPDRSLADIRHEIATDDFRRALFRLERHFNPNWPLQRRLPRGLAQRVSGTWTDGDGLVIPASTGIITHVTREVVKFAVRRALPYLRKPPRRWSGRAPNENEFDEFGRVAPPTPRRPEHPYIWFHSDSELKRYLGSGRRRTFLASYCRAEARRQRPLPAGMDSQHRQRHKYSGCTPSVRQCGNEQNKTAQWGFDGEAVAGA